MTSRFGLTRSIMAALLVAFAMLWPTAVAIAQAPEQGIAMFYNDKYHGKKTTSGEVYDKDGLTAAHKTLPYGTKLKVTNLANDKSVVVTVNDRLSKSSKAVIDLTTHAADQLGFLKSGTTKVKLEVQK